MNKFPDFDDWTEHDLLCGILHRLRREINHAQLDPAERYSAIRATQGGAPCRGRRKADPKAVRA